MVPEVGGWACSMYSTLVDPRKTIFVLWPTPRLARLPLPGDTKKKCALSADVLIGANTSLVREQQCLAPVIPYPSHQ